MAIYNLPEPEKYTWKRRRKGYQKVLTGIIQNTGWRGNQIDHYCRLGMFQMRRNRPVKVIFQNIAAAKYMLAEKWKLKDRGPNPKIY